MKKNAIVVSYANDGYVVATQNGLSGLLKTEDKIEIGSSINVDIQGNKTVEFKKEFWGPEFKIAKDYTAFWTHSWSKTYIINEDFKVVDDIFSIIYEDKKCKYIHKNTITEFYSGGTIVDFTDFIISIELGVTKKELIFTFMYSFFSVPYESSVIKVFSCSSELNDF